MATITPETVAARQVEAIHAGVNATVCNISLSGATSAGDVIRIGKLPHQAQVLDAVFYPGAALPPNSVWAFGVSASVQAFILALSASAAGILRATSPTVFSTNTSRSDDNAQRYTYIVAKPTAAVAAGSAGHQGTLVVFYRMPGQPLA